ncbi:double-strand break repair protein AddB [Litoreibacter sp.]|nr:double-strand break repair protein AddB [Litoreibacter sp.]
MFDPTPTARVFGMPIGVDFPQALVDGILARLQTRPPEALARVQLYVNTSRMQRRVRRLFAAKGALLLPQIRLITELSTALNTGQQLDIPPAVDGLGRRLDLARLVRALIERDPELAAEETAFDLADSLATLLDEMQDEAVPVSTVSGLDVSHHSGHWARSQRFIELVHPYLAAGAELDTQGRMRAIATALDQIWQVKPPSHPIIIAGSTGSRGTTRAFMKTVARLPQGAVILPGVDFDMPAEVWEKLGEDHPQFRGHKLMRELDLQRTDLGIWNTELQPQCGDRNKLVSLALRPAPVTDAWLDEGPILANLTAATQDLTLVEAPTPRIETLAIALRLRKAAEDGISAALITPDQTLARRVTAALSAWHIIPNDSAGTRLDLSPPGRLLRQTAAFIGEPVAPAKLLALLKHPLVWAENRTAHLSKTRHLEMKILRGGPPALTRSHTQTWADNREADDPGTLEWHDWLWSILDPLSAVRSEDLTQLADLHILQSERLTQGPDGTPPHLWLKSAGEKAQITMQNLQSASGVAGRYTPSEYRDLLDVLLAREEVRDPFFSHPDIMIWGTLEARVQGAQLVILAGLNDGTWPKMPPPDPWLNRDMRMKAGLPVPEERIGLSAHDFQQAIAADQVWITRSVRDAEAETVQSRWLNRIQNLMSGLPGEGPDAFGAMQARGQDWVKQAQAYDAPRLDLAKATRPAPQPPIDVRPKDLWVTHIETLIRDPYAIYARHILKLRPVKPLRAQADAALRGDVIHKILHAFTAQYKTALPEHAETVLLEKAQDFFNRHVAWPATRTFWMAKLARAVPWFVQTENARRALATPDAFEADGKRALSSVTFTLHGRADRVDRDPQGALVLYDYKTGQLPTKKVQDHFNKQLPLLAAIGAANGYEGFPSEAVKEVAYIGLGATPAQMTNSFDHGQLDKIWTEFEALIAEYMDPEKGYTARRAVYESRWDQDYDVLSRFGEWDRTDDAAPTRVGV